MTLYDAWTSGKDRLYREEWPDGHFLQLTLEDDNKRCYPKAELHRSSVIVIDLCDVEADGWFAL